MLELSGPVQGCTGFASSCCFNYKHGSGVKGCIFRMDTLEWRCYCAVARYRKDDLQGLLHFINHIFDILRLSSALYYHTLATS